MALAAVVLALAFPALVTLVVVAWTVANRRPDPAPSEAARAAESHAAGVQAIAWVVGLLVAVTIAMTAATLARAIGLPPLSVGVVIALLPAAAGLSFLAVHAVGERTWPRPEGPARRASLVPRRLADVAPRGLRVLTWGWATLLTVALVVGGATAGPDGRSFVHGTADQWWQTSPYPGWFYGAWMLPAGILVLAAAEAVLRLVAGRPAIVDAAPEYDAASRRLSAHRVLRGTQLALASSLAGVLLGLGYGPHSMGLHALGYGLGVAAGAVLVAGAVVAMLPARLGGADAGTAPVRAVASLR